MQTYRFGDFELDLDALQLRLHGEPVRLERRPLDLLVLLVRHRGRMVAREEIIAALWPARVIIDFESGVNTLVRKARHALGDSSDHPKFIETVPGRGYRFIAPVVAVTEPAAAPEQPVERPAPSRPPSRLSAASLFSLLAIAAAAFVWQAGYLQPARITDPGGEAPTGGRHESETPNVDPGAGTLAVLPLTASAGDDESILLAESVTDLIRNRLAALEGLTVIASSSTSNLAGPHADIRSVGETLRARFLLQGTANRTGDRLRVAVRLVDSQSGKELWSTAFDRPLAEVALIREEIFRRVAGDVGIPVETAASSDLASAGISLDAYQLYLRGQHLLAGSATAGAERAVELFRRATILDPGFARAYLGLGQALLESALETAPFQLSVPLPADDAGAARMPDAAAQAAQAFDRALELNPALGEAWIGHAGLARDPVRAEALYRKGLGLAPNYGTGYLHYAEFLLRQGRPGEAIETITRARRIDPLTPELHLLHAFLLIVVRSDRKGHDRLVREALEINPRLRSGLYQLAGSLVSQGEFADAAQLIERTIAVDPQSHDSLDDRGLARDIYLDLGDPAAAAAALGDSPEAVATMELAQYAGDRATAAALLKEMPSSSWRDVGPFAPMAEAIRDGAIATGELESAVRRLETVHAKYQGGLPMWYRGVSLVFAHTLVLAGEVERGRRLAESVVALLDAHSIGRDASVFSRERAAAFAVLGEDERVLEELALSVKDRNIFRWWYLAGRDPLYEHLRRDPRFQALDEEARRHIARQRARLEAMRRDGDIPTGTSETPP